MECTHYRVQRYWFVLIPSIILIGLSASCDSIFGTPGANPADAGAGGAVSLRLENSSGVRASVEATFQHANSVVRTTTRLLTAFGPESTEVVLSTLCETVTVVARADEASPSPVNARVERGDILLERVYRRGEDYFAGGTILFVVPPLDDPAPSIIDCNANGIADAIDISAGTSLDCDFNSVPDECDIRDYPELDCNANGILDQCDIESATSHDQNENDIPDECEPQGLILTTESPFVSPEWPMGGVVWLLHAAPAGGMPVDLQITDLNIATVAPESVVIQEGWYGAVFEVHGIQPGTTILTATASGLDPVTTPIVVSDAAIDLAATVEVAPDELVPLPLSLSVPAPAGGVFVLLESDDVNTATVTPSVLVPEGSQVPLVLPVVTGRALGSATITATSPLYASDTAEVLVKIDMSFDHGYVSIKQGESVDLRLRMTAAVPDLQIDLETDNDTVATVPTPLIAGNCETCQVVTVTGAALGTTILRASAIGVDETTAVIEVVGEPEMYFANLLVGNNLETYHHSYERYLAEPAPSGGVDVTLISQDPSRVLLAALPGEPGSGSLVVHVPSDYVYVPQFFVQGLDDGFPEMPLVEVTVSAPGYVNASFEVELVPSGFIISWPGDFSTTTLSGDRPVCVTPVCLDPDSNAVIEEQQIRGGLPPFGVDLTSSNPLVGTILPSPLVFYAGIAELCAYFTPLAIGTTDIFVEAPGDSDWRTPATDQEITASVNDALIQIQDISVGVDLQKQHYTYDRRLSEPAPVGGCVVTLTSDDPAKVKLLAGGKGAGAAIINLTVPEGSRQIPSFFVQALAGDGVVEVFTSAPGYHSEGSFNVTLGPSGFYIDSPWSYFDTTPLSDDTEIFIAVGRLDPSTLEVVTEEPSPQLQDGLPPRSVLVQSSQPSVGSITTSLVTFNAGDSEVSTWFDPATVGTAVVGLQTAPLFDGRFGAFSTPSDKQEVTAYVDEPTINIYDDAIGKHLQALPQSYYRRLSVAAPAGGVDVTLTSQDPARVLLSPDGEATGSVEVVLHVPEGSRQIPPFYVQGLDDSGSATIDIEAPGFESGAFDVVFYPSGFCIATPTSIHTTAFSAPSNIGIRSARLAQGTFALQEYLPIRGGGSPVDVAITCSNSLVGTISPNPVVVQPKVEQVETEFEPHNEGSAVITLSTPAGYATPSTRQSIGATVANPGVVFNQTGVDIGLGLQIPLTVYLDAPPPSPVDVVVTSCDAGTVSVSKDIGTAGAASVVFPGVTGTHVGTVHVQGQGLSCTTLTGTATGYADGKCQATVSPAGFIISSPSDFTRTLDASDVPVYLYSVGLDLTTLDLMYYLPVRGGLTVNVAVTSSDPVVGLIGPSPVTFSGGHDWRSTSFDVLAVGVTDIGVSTPSGFATPSYGQFVRATVEEWPAEGACCLDEGWCLELTEAVCVSFGGVYEGDGSTCDPSPCSQPATGACCLPDYTCSQQTESSCQIADGEYQGDGSYCYTGLCGP